MRSTWSLLCLAAVGALLMLCSDVTPGPAGVNCRKQAFHPMCRGVQVKRAFPPGPHQLHNTSPRKQDEDGPDPEYIPVPVSFDLTGENPPRRALWSYLSERPASVLLAHRKLEPETLELYDYE